MFGTVLEFFSRIYKSLKDAGKNNWSFAILVAACMFVTFWMNKNFEERVTEKLTNNIETIEKQKEEAHKQGFAASMETYYNIKSYMRHFRSLIGCEYILFLEYHNGAENIATGYQFCKFDITMEAKSDSVPSIQIDNFKDESIFKYDIFMHNRVSSNRISVFSIEDLRSIDPYFYQQIKSATPAEINTVVTSHIHFEGHKAGALIFLFTESDKSKINMISTTNCASKIEEILIQDKNKKL